MYDKAFYAEKITIPENKHSVKIGDRFCNLTVIEQPYWREKKRVIQRKDRPKSYGQKCQFVECKCDCGNSRICNVTKLKLGKIPSCKQCSQKSFSQKRQKGSRADNGIKKCSSCLDLLDVACFSFNKDAIDGYHSQCKTCGYINRIHKKFGIDISYLKNKKLNCEICLKEIFMPNESKHKHQSVVIDHDHNTNQFRGILCSNCNSVLGYAKDNINILNRAVIYLNNFGLEHARRVY